MMHRTLSSRRLRNGELMLPRRFKGAHRMTQDEALKLLSKHANANAAHVIVTVNHLARSVPAFVLDAIQAAHEAGRREMREDSFKAGFSAGASRYMGVSATIEEEDIREDANDAWADYLCTLPTVAGEK
jgi:hypothetical protein